MSTLRGYLYAAAAVLVLVLSAWLYWKGGQKVRGQLQTVRAEAKAVARSNKISTQTQRRVDVQGAEVRARTQLAQEVIRDRILEVPVPVGPTDADLLRVANEAYQRAIRATCRVQRTSDCPAATGTD